MMAIHIINNNYYNIRLYHINIFILSLLSQYFFPKQVFMSFFWLDITWIIPGGMVVITLFKNAII